jgi:preprotein translocase subunit SecE
MKIIDNITGYFKSSYEEMKKVSWPTKKQTIQYSLLVVGMSVGFAVFFSILDYAFNWGITEMLIKL